MKWEIYIARCANKQLSEIPAQERRRILLVLQEMQEDPFLEDVVWLKNQPHTLRRRIGEWRILFDIDSKRKLILVGNIMRRNDHTYK